jgi:hypothetical protein
MQHSIPKRRDPFVMVEEALAADWQPIDLLPLKGEGAFLVLTLSGLIRLARNRRETRHVRPADGYGPPRATVGAVVSGNYLTAIAWKWPEAA